MKFAKKMLMIPEAEYLALRSAMNSGDYLQNEKASLDARISQNLQDPGISEDLKAKRHDWLYKERRTEKIPEIKDNTERLPYRLAVRFMESTPAKYALRKVEMRSIFLGTGRTELSHNVFTSTLPRRLICTFVSTDAYSGARHLSPFNFEHANIHSISAEANGLTFPSTPYLFSFGNQKRFVRAFVDMYAGLGLDDSDNKTVSISMARFLSGWAFFVIPMTSTLDDTPGFELIRQGTCTVKVQFEQPIKADGYEMLILGEFDSVLSINADRVLSTDGIYFESIRQIEPTACFEYNGKSYVFFEDREADELHLYRGHEQKIVKKFLANINRLMFDYIAERLYISDKYERRISEIELSYLERSEPLYVELTDLMVCPGDLQKCLSHFGHRKDQRNLVVDELDWHDEDDDITEGAW
ncbi:hypothetical protein niasHS_008602 [Heterodera schachtii]|uniref:Uncharacterized protein n=1 Tax=Heterodera schachtii TaxID=97005 RepID=A0ABD2J885_HETSC